MDGYIVILSDIAKVQVGFQARVKIEKNLGGEYGIVRSQDFDDAGKLALNQLMHFTSPIKVDPKNYLISSRDILVQARGQDHYAYFIKEPLINTVASNSFYIIRVNQDTPVIPAYLAWWINQPIVQAYFKQEQGLSTIPFISVSGLSKTQISVPPLAIQDKISQLNTLWKQEQGLFQRIAQKKELLIQAVARKAIAQSMENR